MAWDQDEKGNIIAVRLKSFEVAAYSNDNVVLVRLLVGSTNVQVALDPAYAAALASISAMQQDESPNSRRPKSTSLGGKAHRVVTEFRRQRTASPGHRPHFGIWRAPYLVFTFGKRIRGLDNRQSSENSCMLQTWVHLHFLLIAMSVVAQ